MPVQTSLRALLIVLASSRLIRINSSSSDWCGANFRGSRPRCAVRSYGRLVSASVWVARLIISSRVAEKITSKHGLQVADLRAAVVGIARLGGRWDDDPERGRRFLLVVSIGSDEVLLVLYPTEERDVWKLGSAYRHDSHR